MSKIVLVSTSHVARESLERVKKAVEKEKPDCIAVELDIDRYRYMQSEEKNSGSTLEMIKHLGLATFSVYWIMKKFQNYFGKKTGIMAGSEMLKAIELAKEKKITVALIDRPIGITLARIKSLPLSEKLGLFKLLVMGVFGIAMPFVKKEQFDLNKVPSKKIVNQAMDLLEKELPGFYKILVHERNIVMARNLKNLTGKFDKIVCVIGAGHEKGMKNVLIEHFKITTPLKKLRTKKVL